MLLTEDFDISFDGIDIIKASTTREKAIKRTIT